MTNIFGGRRKGKRELLAMHLDGRSEIDLAYMVSPLTKTLFFMGTWHRASGLSVDFSGFVHKGDKRQTYGGNVLTTDNHLGAFEERRLLESILAATRWNGFNPRFFKE